MQKLDLSGRVFGRLTVLEQASTKNGRTLWKCLCTCGNIKIVTGHALTSNRTTSCGCAKHQASNKRKDLTNCRFGRLTVLAIASTDKKGIKWKCQCDCGNISFVRTNKLTSGKTKSCGCLRKETPNNFKDLTGYKFGFLEVLKRAKNRGRATYWLCKCTCGKEVEVFTGNLTRGKTKSCGCITGNGSADTSILAKEFSRPYTSIKRAKEKLFGDCIAILSNKQKKTMQQYFESTQHRIDSDTSILAQTFKHSKSYINRAKRKLFGFSVNLSAEQKVQLKEYFHLAESKGKSLEEKEVVDFIKSIYKGEVIENDRDLIAPKEIDIYIPEKKLAIEYNGLIWHSSKYNKDKYYHLNKTKACEEKGVRLIHIFSCVWESKKEIIKSMLASALGVYERKEYARTLEIREVTDRQAINKFFDENHMQGSIKTWSYGIGLFKGEELLQACLFGGKRFKGEKATELLRMATKLNIQVIGGFSKLMKHCPYDNIVSYIHRTYFSGIGYLVGKWKLEGYTEPELYYTDGKDIYSRHLFNKEAMKKRWENIDETKAQREIAEEHGFYQLYGSGNIKVRWTREK